jgi:2-polyprenyl-6-hydroxyphenyl methylase / 3-demethylubiquinone-9 3-methyltransferase
VSAPTEYYDRYWSKDGYRPIGSLHPLWKHVFEAYVSPTADCLDLGCGDGRTAGLWLFQNAAKYVGVDISQPAVDEARAIGLDARRIDDAGALPFEDCEFDVVICIEVLEHLLEPQRAAAEALRVLRPGGVFLASVPNVAYWRRRLELGLLARWNPYGDDLSTREPWRDPHIRFFTPRTLKRMLEEKGGFTDVRTRGIGGAFLWEVPALRRFISRKASVLYRSLERSAPTLFGTRILAIAHKSETSG